MIVQVGHNSLREAQELAKHAQQIGASAISATCPSYFKVASVQSLTLCMQELAAAAPETPFYYYHIPVLTGSSIDMVEFLTHADEAIPTLVGLKYTDTMLFEFNGASNCRIGSLTSFGAATKCYWVRPRRVPVPRLEAHTTWRQRSIAR